MTRRLINLATVLWLLLCVVVCTLWVRSHVVADTLTWSTAELSGVQATMREKMVGTGGGQFVFHRRHMHSTYDSERDARHVAATWWKPLTHQSYSDAGSGLPRRSNAPWAVLGFDVMRGSRVLPTTRINVPGAVNAGAVTEEDIVVVAPLWFGALLTALPPALWAVRFRRHRNLRLRAQRRLCAACGYDLRASPDRCPECGASQTADTLPA